MLLGIPHGIAERRKYGMKAGMVKRDRECMNEGMNYACTDIRNADGGEVRGNGGRKGGMTEGRAG